MQTDLIHVLMDMRSGAVASELSKEFNELIEAILTTGRGGSFTLSLDVAPSKVSMAEGILEMKLSHKSSMKKPKQDVGESHFFVTRQGGLTRHDPSQMSMEEQVNASESR